MIPTEHQEDANYVFSKIKWVNFAAPPVSERNKSHQEEKTHFSC